MIKPDQWKHTQREVFHVFCCRQVVVMPFLNELKKNIFQNPITIDHLRYKTKKEEVNGLIVAIIIMKHCKRKIHF